MSRRFAVALPDRRGKRALTGSVSGASPRGANTGTERMSLLETAGRPDEGLIVRLSPRVAGTRMRPKGDRGWVRDAISRGASGGACEA